MLQYERGNIIEILVKKKILIFVYSLDLEGFLGKKSVQFVST